MATAKERAIKAELLKDPEYRTAWDAYDAALEAASEDIQRGFPVDPTETAAAAQAVFEVLNRRPDLVALIELAEQPDH